MNIILLQIFLIILITFSISKHPFISPISFFLPPFISLSPFFVHNLVLFYLFDKKKTGYVDRDDLKHFIIGVHGGTIKSNAQLGLHRIEEKPRHDFKDLRILHRDFPHLLYPVFRLQLSMMRVSLGEAWWDSKKLQLAEEMRIKRKNEQSQFAGERSEQPKGTEDEEAIRFENRVKETMGTFNYYVTFWKREIIRVKLRKMDAIEKELNNKLKKDEADEEEDEKAYALSVKEQS